MDKTTLVDAICEREWQMFSQVQNNGGPASCQQDAQGFKRMRTCQFAAWDVATLALYLEDLDRAGAEGRNLPMEKYAWMMERTHPDEFAALADDLPPLTQEQRDIITAIVRVQVDWEAAVDTRFPHVRAGGRPLRSAQDAPGVTSFETYLEGELKSYSLATLQSYLAHVRRVEAEGGNLALDVAEHTARAYGFASLADMEQHLADKRSGRAR